MSEENRVASSVEEEVAEVNQAAFRQESNEVPQQVQFQESLENDETDEEEVKMAGEEDEENQMHEVNSDYVNMVELKPKRGGGRDGFLSTMSNFVSDRNQLGGTQTLNTNHWADSGNQTYFGATNKSIWPALGGFYS